MHSWFISAVVSISTVPDYVNMVIPSDQTFDERDYAGVFHFRFWHYGRWIDVCVDDKLPVDENDKLMFCYNQIDVNELFGPLLEKAYAKLNKSYEFLIGGNLIDGLIDLTGGVHETFTLAEYRQTSDEQRARLWELIFTFFRLKSIGGAILKSTSNRHSNLHAGKDFRSSTEFLLAQLQRIYNLTLIFFQQRILTV